VALKDFRHHLLTKCIAEALVLDPTMATSKILSPLTLKDPRVQHESVSSSALPTSDRQPVLDMSQYKSSRLESAAVIPQRTYLPIVNEEDAITREDKPIEPALEKTDMENGSSEPSFKLGSAASYKGKRDPFANEGGAGMKYKTMAWWYVMIIRSLKSDFRYPIAAADQFLS
jgi:hypothetical protein